MSLTITRAGLQTTLQAAPRVGHRHFGVPASGPADALSMALANKLVGGRIDQVALEITLMGMSLTFNRAMTFAVCGSDCDIELSGETVGLHTAVSAKAGDVLDIGPARGGARSYLAVSGTVGAEEFLSSTSTYLPGGFGGFAGRALKDGDEIDISDIWEPPSAETPRSLRPYFNDRFVLQVCAGPDLTDLDENAHQKLLSEEYKCSQRASRMGLELVGEALNTQALPSKTSSAVFPGTVQCPPNGNPYVLLSDAQTTGGYPHLLQVIRSDRFQLGQIRPGSAVRFVLRNAEDARRRLVERSEAYSDWLGDVFPV
ncbi:MAG: allophanate hydrolase [Ponticaulis sp.]|nr:allophanate hydrolase [Ponticaulis sp.]